MKGMEAVIIKAALVCCMPGRKDVSLAGYSGIKYVFSLYDNVIYRNTAAAPDAHRCKIIK